MRTATAVKTAGSSQTGTREEAAGRPAIRTRSQERWDPDP
jgi:hypothetical protein